MTFTALLVHNPQFRRLWLAQVVSQLGDWFSAVAVYSDMAGTGDFSCSNPDVNRFVENTRWSMKGNFLDVPTDCPQRDERLGWTGDAQVFSRTAAFNMDVAGFMTKWLRDVAADLAASPPFARMSAIANALVLALFVLTMATSVLRARTT